MYISRLQALLSTVSSKFRRAKTDEKDHNQEIEELAEQITEYGRMIQHDCSHQRLFVNVAEVARRFREDRRRVIKALVLLRTQGRAYHTARSDEWKLYV